MNTKKNAAKKNAPTVTPEEERRFHAELTEKVERFLGACTLDEMVKVDFFLTELCRKHKPLAEMSQIALYACVKALTPEERGELMTMVSRYLKALPGKPAVRLN